MDSVAVVTGSEKSPPGGDTAPTMVTLQGRPKKGAMMSSSSDKHTDYYAIAVGRHTYTNTHSVPNHRQERQL